MYGEAFHHWKEAQRLIKEIEAQEPEVREIVRKRYETSVPSLQAFASRQALPSMAETVKHHQQLYQSSVRNGFPFLGGLLG